jgi:hypothetical protein
MIFLKSFGEKSSRACLFARREAKAGRTLSESGRPGVGFSRNLETMMFQKLAKRTLGEARGFARERRGRDRIFRERFGIAGERELEKSKERDMMSGN